MNIKESTLSKLNWTLIVFLVIGLVVKAVWVLQLLTNAPAMGELYGNEKASSVVVFAGIAILIIHALIIWGVYKRAWWIYGVCVIFVGNYFKNFNFSQDMYSPLKDGIFSWFMLLDLMNVVMLVISLVLFISLFRKKKEKKSKQ